MKRKSIPATSDKGVRLPKMIVQSNLITLSKQGWTWLEKKILYIILSQLGEYHRWHKNPDMSRDLFLTFDGRLMHWADKDIRQICETLKNMKHKSVEIRSSQKQVAVKLINYAGYDLKNDEVKVQISHEALPYFFNLTERFSQIALHTVLECKSVYSQRLFELCSMFSSVGFFSLGLEQMRELFGMDEWEYADDRNDLVRWVVKEPQNELFDLYSKRLSRLFFTCFERQSRIVFLIHSRHEPLRNSIGHAKMIAVLLSGILDYEQSVIDGILIKYSTLHAMTDFSELYRALATVKIHTESILEQREKVSQILYTYSIHPNQNNALWKNY